MGRIALSERPPSRSRGVPMPVMQGVVRRRVVRIARGAGCGMDARGAVRPLWAAWSCVEVVQIDARGAGRATVLSVMLTEPPSCRRDSRRGWSAHAGGYPKQSGRNAEHAVPADAAARPRDRGFFEAQNRPERDLDRAVAAPLNFSVRRPGRVIAIPSS